MSIYCTYKVLLCTTQPTLIYKSCAHYLAPIFLNVSSAGPQKTPFNPPEAQCVWVRFKSLHFSSLQQLHPCFLQCPNNTMSSVACLWQRDPSSRQLTARLLPVLVTSMEGALHCLILPSNISGSANKTTSPEQTATTSMLIKTRQASFARPQTFTFHPLI